MPLSFFGLDGEMSAPDLEAGGRLIQIGVAALPQNNEPSELFCSLINPGGTFSWSHRAEGIHGFTREEIAEAPPAAEVDEELYRWLLEQGVTDGHRGNVIPVGFNVGSFDMPHVAAVLPRSYSLFSRRTVDLNALCFTLDGAEYNGNPVSWSGWKRLAKTYAERIIRQSGETGAEHDAGYDALIHIYGWLFLRSVSHGDPLTLPQTPVPAPVSRALALKILEVFGAEKGAAALGIHPEVLRGWSSGGRATRPHAIEDMQELLASADW